MIIQLRPCQMHLFHCWHFLGFFPVFQRIRRNRDCMLSGPSFLIGKESESDKLIVCRQNGRFLLLLKMHFILIIKRELSVSIQVHVSWLLAWVFLLLHCSNHTLHVATVPWEQYLRPQKKTWAFHYARLNAGESGVFVKCDSRMLIWQVWLARVCGSGPRKHFHQDSTGALPSSW